MPKTNIPLAALKKTPSLRTLQLVESCCTTLGLECTLKTETKSLPGSTHWHYKLGKQPGTLEITVDPSSKEIWATVRTGPRAEWMDGAVEMLRRKLGEG